MNKAMKLSNPHNQLNFPIRKSATSFQGKVTMHGDNLRVSFQQCNFV
jgi:hypothetical protein